MISNSKRIVKTLMSRLRVVPRLALPMLLKNTNSFISDKGNCLKAPCCERRLKIGFRRGSANINHGSNRFFDKKGQYSVAHR